MMWMFLAARVQSANDIAVVHVNYALLVLAAVLALRVTLTVWWASRANWAAHVLLLPAAIWVVVVGFYGWVAVRTTDTLWSFDVLRFMGLEWGMVLAGLAGLTIALLIPIKRSVHLPWLLVAQVMGAVALALGVGMLFSGYKALDFS